MSSQARRVIEHPAGIRSLSDMLCVACLRSLGDDKPLMYVRCGESTMAPYFGPLCESCTPGVVLE